MAAAAAWATSAWAEFPSERPWPACQ